MAEKVVIRTDAAPAPFQGAPYSQAISANGFVFVSGQLALLPGHTELVPGGITEQTFAEVGAEFGVEGAAPLVRGGAQAWEKALQSLDEGGFPERR